MRHALTVTDDRATTAGERSGDDRSGTALATDPRESGRRDDRPETTFATDPGSRETPELPDLDPGVRLLSTDERTDGALYSLVVDHLLCTPGRAWWVDAAGRARTRRLADLAPSGRLLDRIRVARGFTAFQHLALVETLGERHRNDDGGRDPEWRGGSGTATADPRSPALVVAPAVDAPYRADDLRAEERREMLVRALAVLSGIGRRHDCPVLVTRTGEDDLAEPVAAAARDRIRCESTPEGPRFVADGFETTVYPVAEGWVQTTFAFWRRVLRARAADRARSPGPSGSVSDAPAVARPDGPVTTAAGGPAATGR